MGNILPFVESFLKPYLNQISYLRYMSFHPSAIQAALIVVLLFLLVLTLAYTRRHMIGWSFRGMHFGFIAGILFILILEAVVFIGGKTAFSESQNTKLPGNIQGLLQKGRKDLINVLGLSTEEIPKSDAKEKPNIRSVLKDYENLSSDEAKIFRRSICEP